MRLQNGTLFKEHDDLKLVCFHYQVFIGVLLVTAWRFLFNVRLFSINGYLLVTCYQQTVSS